MIVRAALRVVVYEAEFGWLVLGVSISFINKISSYLIFSSDFVKILTDMKLEKIFK